MVGFLLKMNCCCTESIVNKLLFISSTYLPRTILEASTNSKVKSSCTKNSSTLTCHNPISYELPKFYYIHISPKIISRDFQRNNGVCLQHELDQKFEHLQSLSVKRKEILHKAFLTSTNLHNADAPFLPLKVTPIMLNYIMGPERKSSSKPSIISNLEGYPFMSFDIDPLKVDSVFQSTLNFEFCPKTNSSEKMTSTESKDPLQSTLSLFSNADCKDSKPQSPNKPSEELLNDISDHLISDAPRLFNSYLGFHYHAEDVIFENRIKGFTLVGLLQYKLFMRLFVIYGHLKGTDLRCVLLKITQHPDESLIKVRWQIQYNRRSNFLSKKSHMGYDVWLDGYSILTVDGKGKISKHIADNMMPDEDKNNIEKLPFLSRIALLRGLSAKTAGAAFSSLQNRIKSLSLKKSLTSPIRPCTKF